MSGRENLLDADRDTRPATVTAACVLTWIASLFTLMLGLLVIYGLFADRHEFVDRLAEQSSLQDVSPEDAFAGLVVVAGVLVSWCAVAMLLAAGAFRRSRAARKLLVVSAAAAALLSLPGVLVVYPVLTLICGTSAVVMLGSPSSKAWYDRGRT